MRDVELRVLPDESTVRLVLHLTRMAAHTVETHGQQLRVTLQASSTLKHLSLNVKRFLARICS